MICKQKRKECAYIRENGECDILSNTTFNRPCPFFKKGANEVERDYFFNGFMGIFRMVRGYDGHYYVSEYGEVISMTKKICAIKHDMQGYPCVQLRNRMGNYTQIRISHLVADAFIPGDGQVRHLDGNKDNCERYNLYREK